ncbi:protein-tyrosine-phosphatase [Gordonia jinghuaiqii]|uniref:Tyrosine-protein phosphatase n=1 Tax=Gordonia jinghuaiqii TaxID=2758710 RepID=A0A7D7LXG6_9ACTN|nr:tyrosine-protein phosphatase [Gordonia jinghuaiqii]MCR5979374.1 protein-tyrosine-phosphatase [Gordonia jinghuaiqii]QMT01156.1 tyrosine-protein phosphatase [Gordonia jinghuaiqii]
MTLSSDAELRTFANIRDLGGMPVAGGRSTAHNVLIRSDAPYPGDDAPDGLPWPPATVVDLRDPTELGSMAVTWPRGVRVVHRQVSSGARIDRLADTALLEIYTAMMRTGGHRLTAALNAFDPTGATLVHCAAGKDRTGVIVAIALLLAGVDESSVIADYQRTEEGIAGVFARLRERRRIPAGTTLDAPILRTPREAIELVVEDVTGASGGAWGWFEANGGDAEHFRRWVDVFTPATAADGR